MGCNYSSSHFSNGVSERSFKSKYGKMNISQFFRCHYSLQNSMQAYLIGHGKKVLNRNKKLENTNRKMFCSDLIIQYLSHSEFQVQIWKGCWTPPSNGLPFPICLQAVDGGQLDYFCFALGAEVMWALIQWGRVTHIYGSKLSHHRFR